MRNVNEHSLTIIHQEKDIIGFTAQLGTSSKILKGGLWSFLIFLWLEPFFYYFVFAKTMNMSNT